MSHPARSMRTAMDTESHLAKPGGGEMPCARQYAPTCSAYFASVDFVHHGHGATPSGPVWREREKHGSTMAAATLTVTCARDGWWRRNAPALAFDWLANNPSPAPGVARPLRTMASTRVLHGLPNKSHRCLPPTSSAAINVRSVASTLTGFSMVRRSAW